MFQNQIGHIKAATSSLRAARGRSLLTMAGIIIGVSSVVTLIGLGTGLKHQVNSQIEELGDSVLTIRSGQLSGSGAAQANYLALLNASTLTAQDPQIIAALPEVQSVSPMAFVTNTIQAGSANPHNISVIGVGQDFPQMLRQQLSYGAFFQDSWSNQNFGVVGSLIANNIFKTPNPVGSAFNIGSTTLRVSGVLAPSSGGLFSVAETDFNSAVFIPFSVAEQITNNHANILQILVRPQTGVTADQAISAITKALTKAHGQQDFSVLKQDDLLHVAGGIIDTLTNFLTAIAAIALIVGGLGVMDILLVNISERTQEIGIRKAIGATNSQILNQFMVEGTVLTVTGGIFGIILAGIANLIIRLYSGLHPVLNLPIIALAFGVTIVLGLVFSAVPALQAARKDPIQALRHE